MRHGKKISKLQRNASHRKALMANLAVSLITYGRIKTTLAKAKALRPYAEKLVTLGKGGTLHNRRRAISILHQEAAAKRLFEVIAPLNAERKGGYCRITKLPARQSDAAPMGIIEWVEMPEDNKKQEAVESLESVTTEATA